jgi:hypothetical protein
MRTIIVLAAAVLLLALVGWISFTVSSDRSSINLETGTIKRDAQEAMESGSELLKEAGDAANSPDTTQSPPAPPGSAQ